MKATLNPMLFAFAILALLAVAIVVFSAWSVNSPAVDPADLKRLHCGMTKTEVEAILGKPDKKGVDPDDASVYWTYGHTLKWYQLRIDFSEGGEVVRYKHDD